jgi:hypothetical protein
MWARMTERNHYRLSPGTEPIPSWTHYLTIPPNKPVKKSFPCPYFADGETEAQLQNRDFNPDSLTSDPRLKIIYTNHYVNNLIFERIIHLG